MNLTILTGVDNKIHYIKNTIKICKPFCKIIHVVDTSPYRKIEHICDKYGILFTRMSPKKWNQDWKNLYYEMADPISEGEWFLTMDSDERPTQLLINNWKNITKNLEKQNYPLGKVPNIFHWNGKCTSALNSLPQVEEYQENQVWTKSNLVLKCDRVKVEAYKNTSAHCGWVGNKAAYIGPYPYNHYKTTYEQSESIVLCAVIMPESYSIKGQELEDIKKVYSKYNIRLPNDLIKLVNDKNLPDELIDLFISWKNSKTEECKHHYKWLVNLNKQKRNPLCGDLCCKYDLAQF